MAMWVWRLAEYGAGEWSNPPARGWDCRRFQINELFERQKLTQGWGIPPLDIRLSKSKWARNMRDWTLAVGGDPCAAEQEYDLLICMLDIKVGDTIFLPKVGRNQVSDDYFTVLTVEKPYEFEKRPPHYDGTPFNRYAWHQGYGHVIPVVRDLIKVFPYGAANTLERSAFAAPFLKRIVRVPEPVPDRDYRGFCTFLLKNNYPFIP